MKFLVLLYADESKLPPFGTPESDQAMAGYNKFYEDTNQAGVFKGGDPVQGSATSSTVRVRDGKTTTSAGPANPAGDQVIGFYELECKDQAEAEGYAARIPAASVGAVEVRPIMAF